MAVLLCQTTPRCYLHGLSAAERGRREAGCFPLPLFLPAGDVPHFPHTLKFLFFPPAAVRGKRKGKNCSSWGSGQARVEVKIGEGTCTPSFHFGHHSIATGQKGSRDRLQSLPLHTGPHQLGCREVRESVCKGRHSSNLNFII